MTTQPTEISTTFLAIWVCIGFSFYLMRLIGGLLTLKYYVATKEMSYREITFLLILRWAELADHVPDDKLSPKTLVYRRILAYVYYVLIHHFLTLPFYVAIGPFGVLSLMLRWYDTSDLRLRK